MEKFGKINQKESGPETKPEYFFEAEFKELELLVLPLIEKLKENIDKGEYDMLIGDDASGRIPTLILRGIINSRKRELNPYLKSSESEIKTRFVAGGQLRSTEQLISVIEKLKPEVKNKVLIVTEYISSGRSMEKLSSALKGLGIPFDIATLKSEFDGEKSNLGKLFDKLKDIGASFGISDPRSEFGKDNIKIPENSKFYYGKGAGDADAPPLIYDNSEISGVKKVLGEQYVIPYKKSYLENSKNSLANLRGKEIQESVNFTREDVNLLVKKTLEKVWGDK
ncbi:MAG: hypothetical protein AAB621_03040 [Patescibacteria group bacterium]